MIRRNSPLQCCLAPSKLFVAKVIAETWLSDRIDLSIIIIKGVDLQLVERPVAVYPEGMMRPTKKVVHIRTPLFVGIRFIDFPSSIRLPKFPYELYPSIRHLPISLGAVYLRPRTHFNKDLELKIPSNKIMMR
jgi:hypothetical protein